MLMIGWTLKTTHIFQTLDVIVFKSLKTIVRERLQLRMYKTLGWDVGDPRSQASVKSKKTSDWNNNV